MVVRFPAALLADIKLVFLRRENVKYAGIPHENYNSVPLLSPQTYTGQDIPDFIFIAYRKHVSYIWELFARVNIVNFKFDYSW